MEVEATDEIQTPPPEAGPGATPRAAPRPVGQASPTPPAFFVYALGQVELRFPSLSLEKEFAQVTGRTETVGLTERQVLESVLSDRSNRYLARQLCWVFTVEGLETYILVPRDPTDFDLLVETVRARPGPGDLDVVIGVLGPIAPPEVCNGLTVPVVVFDQIYSFDRESLISAIPIPEKMAKKNEDQFRAAAEGLFDRIMQLADNAGATDEHRALNYLAVRYPEIYARAAERHQADASMSGVEVRPSRLSGVRKIVDVVFSYTHRQTDFIDKYFVRVDVTDEFPFLVTKLSPFYER